MSDEFDTSHSNDSHRVRSFEELLLERIHAMDPEPFYPRSFLMLSDNPEELVLASLDRLHKDGLITRQRDGLTGSELAVILSPKGRALLEQPERLAGWRDDKGNSHQVTMRFLGLDPALGTPWSTRLLLALVVLNFLRGVWLAFDRGFLPDYFEGHGPDLTPLLMELGAVDPSSLAEGQWWRLLTNGFVHLGFLHLLMNGASLFSVGQLLERIIGWFPTLLVFVVATVWGAGLSLAFQHNPLAGASGGLCGQMAALVVWFAVNRHRLPGPIATSMQRGLIINAVLIIGISMVPGVSGLAHLGGALGGALAAAACLLLGWGVPGGVKQRSPTPSRHLTGIITLLLAGGGALGLGDLAIRNSLPFAQAMASRDDLQALNREAYPEMFRLMRDFQVLAEQEAEPLQAKDKYRRNRDSASQAAGKLEALLPRYAPIITRWKTMELKSTSLQLFRDRVVEMLEIQQKYAAILAECLVEGKRWAMERDLDIRNLRKDYRKALAAFLKAQLEISGNPTSPEQPAEEF